MIVGRSRRTFPASRPTRGVARTDGCHFFPARTTTTGTSSDSHRARAQMSRTGEGAATGAVSMPSETEYRPRYGGRPEALLIGDFPGDQRARQPREGHAAPLRGRDRDDMLRLLIGLCLHGFGVDGPAPGGVSAPCGASLCLGRVRLENLDLDHLVSQFLDYEIRGVVVVHHERTVCVSVDVPYQGSR